MPGHFLAMSPVIGIALGYLGFGWGFPLAYVLTWVAFLHFLWRGYQLSKQARLLDQ